MSVRIQIEEIDSVEGYEYLVTELADNYQYRFIEAKDLLRWLMIHEASIDQTNAYHGGNYGRFIR